MFDDWLGVAGGTEPPEPMPEPWNRPDSAVRPDGYAALELQSATLDPSELTDAEVIEAIRGYDHVASWAAARQARMLDEFAHRRPPDRTDAVDRCTVGPFSAWAPDEIGLALTLSRGTATARLERSVRLARVLPATLAAWDEGRIDQAKVNAIHDATLALSDTAAQAVQNRVLPQAPIQTVAQLRAALERAVIAADPAAADARHRRAYRQRRVALNPDRDGMASLWALLSAPDAVTCYGWLTALARGLPAATRAAWTLAGPISWLPCSPAICSSAPPPSTTRPPSATPLPATTPPARTRPSVRRTGARQRRARQPGASQPDARQPDARQPDARQPSARRPATNPPDVTPPHARRPGARRPGAPPARSLSARRHRSSGPTCPPRSPPPNPWCISSYHSPPSPAPTTARSS